MCASFGRKKTLLFGVGGTLVGTLLFGISKTYVMVSNRIDIHSTMMEARRQEINLFHINLLLS